VLGKMLQGDKREVTATLFCTVVGVYDLTTSIILPSTPLSKSYINQFEYIE
jgi:hypothetical protein